MTASVEPTLSDVRRELRALADPEVAAFLQRFFKTGPGEYGEGDVFLGIRVPGVRELARQFRLLPRDQVVELLGSPWHEARLLALLLMVEQYRRSEEERDAIHQAYLANLPHVNNWDLVDLSAEHLIGAHLEPENLNLLNRLAASDSLWNRRVAMMATFHWIKQGVFEPALLVAEQLLADPHDLIHKAVGWMLREVGKRDVAREEAFLMARYRRMPRTMLRYAIEHFPEPRRQQYLRGEI